MRTLCLFTNEFPYGSWEPYLETEIKYYEGFDKVLIFSLQLRKDHKKTKRNIPDNFEVIPVMYAPKVLYLLNVFTILGDINLYREISKLIKTKKLNLHKIVDLFVFFSRSHYEARKIYKKVNRAVFDQTIFYSYRFEYQPYVAYLLKKMTKSTGKIVSRAHRYDLYESRRKCGYIPGREILFKNVENVFPCSDHGTAYLQSAYCAYKDKIETRFLGTMDYGYRKPVRNDVFEIVSCSNIVPVKRVALLAEALACIDNIKIHWTHFGDGVLMDALKKCCETLPANITVDFPGNIKYSEVLKRYYENNYNLFVNVSESEGLPVSIMEAMSFGIPCIATDAGGTNEIINNNEGGVILPVDCTPKIIASEIIKIVNMSDENYARMSLNSRNRWYEKFNASKNYVDFNRELNRLVR